MNEKSAIKKLLTFKYRIKVEAEAEKIFTVNLDFDTLDLIQEPRAELPEWALLGFHQCPNCPLDEVDQPHCPVAVSLVEIFDFFKDFASYDEAEVRIEAMERAYVKQTSLQDIAGAVMGLHMVTSGCPVLDKMRPMVQTHLPFQSLKETWYRFLTMYLFVQYILSRNGYESDWGLNRYMEFYEEIETVNQGFSERISFIEIQEGDVTINAVNILNISGSMATMSIGDEDLKTWTDMIMKHWV